MKYLVMLICLFCLSISDSYAVSVGTPVMKCRQENRQTVRQNRRQDRQTARQNNRAERKERRANRLVSCACTLRG